MSEPTRKIMLNAFLALAFAGALGGAWVLTRHSQAAQTPRSVPLIWHAAYPSTFRPLDLAPRNLPVHPSDAMGEELPDGSARHLYVFRLEARRLATPATLANCSTVLFELFNRVPPAHGAPARMAGQPALELAVPAGDAFIVQRAVLVNGNIFAITLDGTSAMTDEDGTLFNQICDSVTVRLLH